MQCIRKYLWQHAIWPWNNYKNFMVSFSFLPGSIFFYFLNANGMWLCQIVFTTTSIEYCTQKNQFFGWTCVLVTTANAEYAYIFFLLFSFFCHKNSCRKLCFDIRSGSCSFPLFYSRLWKINFVLMRRFPDILNIIAVLIFLTHSHFISALLVHFKGDPNLCWKWVYTVEDVSELIAWIHWRRNITTATDCFFDVFWIRYNLHLNEWIFSVKNERNGESFLDADEMLI